MTTTNTQPATKYYEVREQGERPEESRLLRVAETFAAAMEIARSYNERGVKASVHAKEVR